MNFRTIENRIKELVYYPAFGCSPAKCRVCGSVKTEDHVSGCIYGKILDLFHPTEKSSFIAEVILPDSESWPYLYELNTYGGRYTAHKTTKFLFEGESCVVSPWKFLIDKVHYYHISEGVYEGMLVWEDSVVPFKAL